MAGADQRDAQGAAAPHARVLSWDPGFDAARRFDEAFADWLQHGTPANMEEHHGRAASQLELALDGATFNL